MERKRKRFSIVSQSCEWISHAETSKKSIEHEVGCLKTSVAAFFLFSVFSSILSDSIHVSYL
jgi:hypothetical protein